MATTEPTGYENEPVEVFEPLPETLYPELYQLQGGDSVPESTYYLDILNGLGAHRVLELGCGTGRISEFLREQGLSVAGIDCSRSMLVYDRDSRLVPVAEMDMTLLGFSRCFDAVIIPCNSLNLLGDARPINDCLSEITSVLRPGGLLVLQLFVLDEMLALHPGEKFFQFTLHDMERPGKLIRETIRCYNPDRHILQLEERYKLRPHRSPAANRNYSQTFNMAAFSAEQLADLFTAAGFEVQAMHGSIDHRPFVPGQDSTLFLTARLG